MSTKNSEKKRNRSDNHRAQLPLLDSITVGMDQNTKQILKSKSKEMKIKNRRLPQVLVEAIDSPEKSIQQKVIKYEKPITQFEVEMELDADMDMDEKAE